MLFQLGIFQIVVFVSFFILERLFPYRKFKQSRFWTFWWGTLGVFALFWLRFLLYLWTEIPSPGLIPLDFSSQITEGFVFYLFYSLGNYWFHRIKHSNQILWKYLHRLHHSPLKMETRVAFFRHPFEILINTIYLVIIGKYIFSVSFEVVAVALTIEGCLESFHHANIKIHKKLNFLGYIIQLPDMHLVHHEKGLHRYNYGPFL